MRDSGPRLTLTEMFGLSPWRERAREVLLTARGDAFTPPSKAGLSSLGVLRPALALTLWRGQRPADRLAPITNLYNHTPTPLSAGWSVRRTQVRDYRGGRLSYDSHNGTDFAVPPGTIVVAAAPARVARISNEFNRGGLKIMLDHGHGLVTTSNHLGRVLVREGEVVGRGEPVALSGASGVDFIISLGLSPPHVHFNTWLDGATVDPFAGPEETSLWRRHNDPVPHDGADDRALPATRFDEARVAEALAACRHHEVVAAISQLPDLAARAYALMFQQNYYPTRFARFVQLYADQHERQPLLDLPLRAADYDGARAVPHRS